MNLIQILTALVAGLRDTLRPRLVALLEENAALRARNAELEDTEAAQLGAAQGVVDAYGEVVGVLDHTDAVPTPDPLPDAPAPEDAPAVGDLPAEPVDVPAVPNPSEVEVPDGQTNEDTTQA